MSNQENEEVLGLYNEYWNNFTGALTSSASHMAELQAAGALNDAATLRSEADSLASQYEYYSQRAREIAEQAVDPNTPAAESARRAMDSAADAMADHADQLRKHGLDAYAESHDAIQRSASRMLQKGVAEATGVAGDAADIVIKAESGDYYGAAGAYIGAVAGAAVIASVSAVTLPWIGVGLFVGAVSGWAYEKIFNWLDPLGIDDDANGDFLNAQTWRRRIDPLTLDLDGDGLETVGLDTARPVHFDHNADGVQTATGWVAPDDGFLVLDRNGNGTVDSGAELFGDSTVLADGSEAADGFAALAEQDTNGDGVVDAGDAHWSDLRVWRDLNQNGVSEAEELQTLAETGIASLDVEAQSHRQTLDNGNRIADLGRFTWATGESGEIESVVGGAADIDLAENPFYRQFTDPVPLTDIARALPAMHGSGTVRDMREAAATDPIDTLIESPRHVRAAWPWTRFHRSREPADPGLTFEKTAA
jgi:hypothetical protein